MVKYSEIGIKLEYNLDFSKNLISTLQENYPTEIIILVKILLESW